MTIDEAIKIYEMGAKRTWNGRLTIYAEQCQQMTEWLKEYKRLMIAIDAIKEELESAKYLNYGQLYYLVSGLNKALEIIEKHTSGGDENDVLCDDVSDRPSGCDFCKLWKDGNCAVDVLYEKMKAESEDKE